MIGWIDAVQNRITMYRLLLYHLTILVVAALVLSAFGWLPFSPAALLFSALYLVAVCWAANTLFARVLHAPTNVESVFISAFILTLVMTPARTLTDVWMLTAVAVLAMASKYILVLNKRHMFNPVAIAILVLLLSGKGGASWWVGTWPMLPLVVLGGFLVVRKLRQTPAVVTMIGAALLTFVVSALTSGVDVVVGLRQVLMASPLFFFTTVMFTEPLTTPADRKRRLLYAALVGVLYSLPIQIGRLYATPELALVFGNLFSYITSPNVRRLLRLVEKNQTGPELYDFVFVAERPVSFRPGQYMEWTLPHARSDSRGVRRYFTVAASPTEEHLRIGVRFDPKPSSFKRRLQSLETGDTIVVSQVAGDFVLPKDPAQPCVLIAGGIGITPYRSMIQYLLDRKERRPITIFYAAKTEADFVYKEIFDRAQRELGIHVVYVPEEKSGRLSADVLQQHVPNFRENIFYLSGPRGLVVAFEKILRGLGIPRRHIKKDFFPGYV